jgi:hypothetical protein
MASRLQRPPPFQPVKGPTVKPPPVSNTHDNFSHNTSPTQGPQMGPPELTPATSAPRATIKTLPDVPMHVTKHPNPVGRPKGSSNGDGY